MTGPLEFVKAEHARAEQTAQLIESGGYEPQTWHTEPSRSGRWVWVYSTSRCLGEPPEAAVREDDQPVAIVRTGRNEHQHIALHDPASVLRRIAAERKLLADLLGEPHGSDCWALVGSGRPCDCGRDDRVNLRVRLLAEGWGWEDGAGDG